MHIYVFMVQTSELTRPSLPHLPSTLKKKLRLSGDFFVILIFISPHWLSPPYWGAFIFSCF